MNKFFLTAIILFSANANANICKVFFAEPTIMHEKFFGTPEAQFLTYEILEIASAVKQIEYSQEWSFITPHSFVREGYVRQALEILTFIDYDITSGNYNINIHEFSSAFAIVAAALIQMTHHVVIPVDPQRRAEFNTAKKAEFNRLAQRANTLLLRYKILFAPTYEYSFH